MKGYGFGFPVDHKYNDPYRADTSKQKAQLIQNLRISENLWNQQRTQQSLNKLRKAISLLKFIIANESIQTVKQAYQLKLKDLKYRLTERQQGKQQVIVGNQGNVTYNKKKNSKQSNQLKAQLNEAIITQKPNVYWSDVSGLQNAKNALKEAVILPLRFPNIFKGARKPWSGILLYGPPGTGKTFLAKACATEAQSTFISVSSSDLMSKYVGQSQKLIKQLFTIARQKKPSVIFVDEIDSICGNRTDNQNQASRRVKTQFFVQMQGLGHDQQGVLILGATNMPWTLDPAIRRRFQRRIYIPLPEYEARLHMIKHNIQQDFEQLAKKTQSFSGSDISTLVRDAIYQPVRRLQNATQFKTVNGKYIPCRQCQKGQIKGTWVTLPHQKIDIEQTQKQDFMEALKRTKPSVDKKQLAEYQQFTKSFGQDG